MAANDAAMRPDLDLQDGGVFGAADGGEGAAATLAATLGDRERVLFDDGGQVGVVAATGCRPSGLLAAPPGRGGGPRRGRARGRRGAGFGFAAEELLLAQAQLGAELFDLLLEEGLALEGAAVQGLPVARLTPRFKLQGKARADGARAVREGGRGADRKEGRGGQGAPRRVGADRTTQRSGHANRCSPDRSAGQRS